MHEKDALYPEYGSFGQLLDWHLAVWNTRPGYSSTKKGPRRKLIEFAVAIHANDPSGASIESLEKKLRYWRRGEHLPDNKDVVARICEELFADDPNLAKWKDDLYQAYNRERQVSATTAEKSKVLAKNSRSSNSVEFEDESLKHLDIDQFEASLRRTLELYDLLGNARGRGEVFRTIGDVKLVSGAISQARAAYVKSESIYREINDAIGEANAEFGYAVTLLEESSYDNALDAFFHALDLYKSAGDKFGVAQCYEKVGLIYLIQGYLESAVYRLLSAIDFAIKAGDDQLLASCYASAAEAHSSQKRFAEAQRLWNSAAALYLTLGNKDLHDRYLSAAGRAHAKAGIT